MLNKLRNLTYKYAIPSAVILALLFYALMRGVGWLFRLLPSTTTVRYIYEIVCMLYPMGIVVLFGFADSFKSKKFFKGILCGMTLVVVQAFALVTQFAQAIFGDNAWKPWYLILLGIVSVIGIGIREESIFRATIQNILAKKYANSTKGVWITAIVSALIFGLIHAFNIFTGVDVLPAIIQAITNVGIGLFFAALYLRCGNIWTLVAVHALTDTAGLFESIFLYKSETVVISSISWQSLIGGAIFIGVSLFLLRPSKCREIVQRFSSAADENQM